MLGNGYIVIFAIKGLNEIKLNLNNMARNTLKVILVLLVCVLCQCQSDKTSVCRNPLKGKHHANILNKNEWQWDDWVTSVIIVPTAIVVAFLGNRYWSKVRYFMAIQMGIQIPYMLQILLVFRIHLRFTFWVNMAFVLAELFCT